MIKPRYKYTPSFSDSSLFTIQKKGTITIPLSSAIMIKTALSILFIGFIFGSFPFYSQGNSGTANIVVVVVVWVVVDVVIVEVVVACVVGVLLSPSP